MKHGQNKIVVVGGGKMGLPLACMFARNGARVTVCDLNSSIVEKINQGLDPHSEPEQDRYVREGVTAGLLKASTETSVEVADADAVVILVSAMLTPDRDIDWSNLVSASKAVAKGLKKGALVSYETTLPVGGCRKMLVPVLESSGMKAGEDFHVVFSPERVKSRLVFKHLGTTPKIVGGVDEASAIAGEEFYKRWLAAPVINVKSLEAAEFVKLTGMLYRDVNIALANELATFAETVDLDLWAILSAANTDGETYLLQPGIGVGGHCTPVYPYFLLKGAARLGLDLPIGALGRQVNEAQPERQIARLSKVVGGLTGKRVHILGLAFRPQVREDAYSPATPLQSILQRNGAQVTIEDPLYSDAELEAKGFVAATAGRDPADAIVLNTAHAQFLKPDFVRFKASGVQAVLDGRAVWDRAAVESAGLVYLSVGKGDGTNALTAHGERQAGF